MIEIIYDEENKENSVGKLHIPKNIRQVGEIESKHRIYIEDYAFSYVNKMRKKDIMLPRVAILLGRTSRAEGKQYIFIEGAADITDYVEVKFNNITFSESAWTNIYEEVKRFFDHMEIVGWYLYIQDETPGINTNIRKCHIDNFAGNNKILLLQSNAEEEEEAFYIYHKGQMIKQKGYYIYYEKNQIMQEYMIYHGEEEKIEKVEEVSDHAVKNFRSILQEKKEESHQKKIMAFMYTASTFLVMIVLLIGVTMLNNYDKMKNMEVVLNQISQSVTKEPEDEDNDILVERVEGDVEPEPEEDVDSDTAQGQEETAQGEVADSQAENSNPETAEVEPPVDSGTETAAVDPPAEETGEPAVQEVSNPEATIAEGGQSTQQSKSYKVLRGDTLVGISKKVYNTENMVNEICILNQIENGDQIYAGQEILLP